MDPSRMLEGETNSRKYLTRVQPSKYFDVGKLFSTTDAFSGRDTMGLFFGQEL